MEIVKELTPELAEKIWKHVKEKVWNERVSRPTTLHHLKQLKAQMGRYKAKNGVNNFEVRNTIDACMSMIDKKIDKINKI